MTDAADAKGGSKRRTPRWVLALLFGSLALNLVVVGSVVGAVFKGPPPWASVVVPNLLGYASTFPAERRKQIWEQTVEERRHMRPFRREVRTAREETIKTLLAEPFEKQRFLDAQTRQAEAENHARAAAQDLFAKVAETLTPAERRAFAHWREHRRPPGQNLLDEPEHQAGDPVPPR